MTNNARWRPMFGVFGSANAYYAFHLRLRYHRGSASQYACVDCGKTAKEWSWCHDTNHLSFDSYEPRCRRCHTTYDKPKLSDDDVSDIRWLLSEGNSLARIARHYKVSIGTISNIKHGRSRYPIPQSQDASLD